MKNNLKALWFFHKRDRKPNKLGCRGYLVLNDLHKYEVLWRGNKRLLISGYLIENKKRLKDNGYAAPHIQKLYLGVGDSNCLTQGSHVVW